MLAELRRPEGIGKNIRGVGRKIRQIQIERIKLAGKENEAAIQQTSSFPAAECCSIYLLLREQAIPLWWPFHPQPV